MALKAGIVGLPNVGKSTLFNAITNSHVLAENYPFATIEPNSGTVEVNDERFTRLVNLFAPKKEVRATFEFTDIAGLVKGASKGEGLGNQFLANIRNCDAIVHVVRCFDNTDIIHVEGSIDPLRDIETINYELIMADLEVLTKRLEKVYKKATVAKDKESIAEKEIIEPIIKVLKEGYRATSVSLTKEQMISARNYNLLTLKPMIYVGNISEEDYASLENCKYYQVVEEYAKKEHSLAIPICASTECELSSLTREEKGEYFSMLGITQTGLDKISKASYDILGLKTFFTVGSDEVRAWTFIEGMRAPECAGVIHTDFERGFIKAEVYSYDDINKYETENKLKEAGKVTTVGKEYLVKDGDCLYIKFNVTK